MATLMRRPSLVLAILMAGALTGQATEETGHYASEGSPPAITGDSKNTSGAHNGEGVCNTELTGSYNGSHGGQAWLDATKFPLAGGAGVCKANFGPTKYEACAVTNKQVKIKNVEQKRVKVKDADNTTNPPTPAEYQYVVGEGSVTGAVFDAMCHAPKKVSSPTTAPQDTGSEGKTGQYKSDPNDWDFGWEVLVCSIGGSNNRSSYTVTNNLEVPFDFTWPAVHTPDHPNGWSGTVEPNSTLVYEHVTTDDAVLVHGSPGAVTVTCEDDETLVIGRHVTTAWCPAGSVTIPSPVTGLSANSVPASVTLSWVNEANYDTIQVFRYTDGEEAQAWEIDGAEEGFIDGDPPTGEVRYEVIGVEGGLGDEDFASVTVVRG